MASSTCFCLPTDPVFVAYREHVRENINTSTQPAKEEQFLPGTTALFHIMNAAQLNANVEQNFMFGLMVQFDSLAPFRHVNAHHLQTEWSPSNTRNSIITSNSHNW